MSLIYLSVAWVVGIFLGSKFSPPLALVLVGLIPLPLLFVFRQQLKTIVLTSLCLVTLVGGALCFQSSLPAIDESQLRFYNDGETVEVRGMISDYPEVRDKTTHLRLTTTAIKVGDEWQPVAGKALLFVPRYPAYEYGDVLRVSGELETPPQLDGFDYKDYLAHREIFSTMLYPTIEIQQRGQGSTLLTGIYWLRSRLSRSMANILPEPKASLAQGVILGIRSNIPAPVKDSFVKSGTAHLLAISGLHLSIVAGILLSLGIWLFGRRHYLYIWLALSVIWLFALLTGMHPPIVRGAIMASLFLTAELLGRQRSAFTALAFAAAIMVGLSPHILWDASFQLSFMAMTGLIFLAPPLMALGRRGVKATLGESRAAGIASIITDSFAITLSAIIAVWPLIAHYFGIVSLVSLPATLFALPALPAVIVTGVLAGGLGLIALPVGQVVAWLAWLFLAYMLLVVNIFAAIPVAYIEVGAVTPYLIGAYYLGLALAIYLYRRRQQVGTLTARTLSTARSGMDKASSFVSLTPKKWLIPPLVVVTILVSITAATMPDDKLHVSFLNVGQGDAILVQTPAHHDILIDGGPSPQAIGLGLGQKMPFWDRTIDLVVLTHPHADHLTGLVEVLERYRVKQVLMPEGDGASSIYDEWLKSLKAKQFKPTFARAGQRIDLGDGVVFEVLNPPTPYLSDTESDIDNNGVTLKISMAEVSFLLTADIMWEAESELIARRANLNNTVLKVAHCGSKTSTTPEFLAVASPQVAVISVGDNTYGHPSPEVIARLENSLGPASIYRTDEQGTIEFITDGERLWVAVEKPK